MCKIIEFSIGNFEVMHYVIKRILLFLGSN